MKEDRRARAESLVPPLGRTLHVRLRLTDEDIREGIIERMVEQPHEGMGHAVRWLLRRGRKTLTKPSVDEPTGE